MAPEMSVDEITSAIIGAAIKVHRALGPGLLESVYRICLAFELEKLGFHVKQEDPVPVVYEDVMLECGFRAARSDDTEFIFSAFLCVLGVLCGSVFTEE